MTFSQAKPMNYRHGDLALLQVNKMPKLKESKTNVLLQEGSGGHPHTFKGGKFYPDLKDLSLGFLVAEKTKLYHPEHGDKKVGSLMEASIKDGIYQVIRQVEDTHEGLKPVVD